jgi:ABC-type transporter Mla MlaB component
VAETATGTRFAGTRNKPQWQTTVVVDFSSLRFLDSSGVGALVEAKREADRRYAGLRVVNVDGLPRRVLETLNEYDTLAHGGRGPGVTGAVVTPPP